MEETIKQKVMRKKIKEINFLFVSKFYLLFVSITHTAGIPTDIQQKSASNNDDDDHNESIIMMIMMLVINPMIRTKIS